MIFFMLRLLDKYCTGTSAESTIYRACMVHTKSDQNLQRVKEIITAFIQSCKGKKDMFLESDRRSNKASDWHEKRSFADLYCRADNAT